MTAAQEVWADIRAGIPPAERPKLHDGRKTQRVRRTLKIRANRAGR